MKADTTMPGQHYSRPTSEAEAAIWTALLQHQGRPFRTAKGLEFTYVIRGNELFVSRKDKSVTRATVNMAYRNALDIQASGRRVTGPKQLKTFGASYLYPILRFIGVITAPKNEQLMMEQIKQGIETAAGAAPDVF